MAKQLDIELEAAVMKRVFNEIDEDFIQALRFRVLGF